MEAGLQAAQQQLLAVGSLLLQDPSACPSLAAARAADAALAATVAAVSLEGLAAVAMLRLLEVGGCRKTMGGRWRQAGDCRSCGG